MTRLFSASRLATVKPPRYLVGVLDLRRFFPLCVSYCGMALWLSCAGAASTEVSMSGPDGWEHLMETVIGPGFDEVLVVEAGKDPEDMDFAAIEVTTREMAASMALGYGALEDNNIPDFAVFARNTERWLLNIAESARSGRGSQVQRLIVQGEAGYCQKCHDAVGP